MALITPDGERILTTKEVAAILGVRVDSLCAKLRRGDIPGATRPRGGRDWYIPETGVRAYLRGETAGDA